MTRSMFSRWLPLLALALPVYAQITLTGAMQFSTNAAGAGSPGGSQVWNTLGGDHYYDLWLAQSPNGGLPVNGPSDGQAGINIPLVVGNHYNYFIFGAPGLSTGYNAVNLFFDGNNSTPGISVYGLTNGRHFRPDGNTTLALSGAAVAGANRAYYISGGTVVVLIGYEWHTPTTPPGDVCQAYDFAPGGCASFHGYITLHVAPAAALTTTGTTLAGHGFAPLERVTIYAGDFSFPAWATATADANGAFAIAAPHSDYAWQDVYAVGQNSGKLGAATMYNR